MASLRGRRGTAAPGGLIGPKLAARLAEFGTFPGGKFGGIVTAALK